MCFFANLKNLASAIFQLIILAKFNAFFVNFQQKTIEQKQFKCFVLITQIAMCKKWRLSSYVLYVLELVLIELDYFESRHHRSILSV